MRISIKTARAFSLVEVVVAIGVLAVGVTLVLALTAPLSRSVALSGDSETALRVVSRSLAHLRAQPFQDVRALAKTEAEYRAQLGAEHAGTYDPLLDARVWFASADGGELFQAESGVQDKYFEVQLVRNEALSPPELDEHAAVIAFTIRVRWPTQVSAGGIAVRPGVSADGYCDHTQKETLFVAACVAR
ncbi:MAG: hypothetical protein KBG39_11215 [Opitutaceae bacterium]|jgi:type II secretory pathway pseudopilin PulG|nr:hypothetical protein [Opitutaceae bacterium]